MLNKFTLSFFSICALAYCANANNVGKLNLDEVVVTASGFENSLKHETRNVLAKVSICAVKAIKPTRL